MADGHGGKRIPANPAPVSGPGKYSHRTDGGPAQVKSHIPDLPYGEAKQQMASQSTAPMAGTSPMPAPPSAAPNSTDNGTVAPQMPTYTGGPFNGPSTRPDEPVTAGATIGPGPGPEALGAAAPQPVGQATGQMFAMLQRLSATDTTGVLAKLYQMAAARNV